MLARRLGRERELVGIELEAGRGGLRGLGEQLQVFVALAGACFGAAVVDRHDPLFGSWPRLFFTLRIEMQEQGPQCLDICPAQVRGLLLVGPRVQDVHWAEDAVFV